MADASGAVTVFRKAFYSKKSDTVSEQNDLAPQLKFDGDARLKNCTRCQVTHATAVPISFILPLYLHVYIKEYAAIAEWSRTMLF